MADRLLVLVPHEHTHAPRSILQQARKLSPDVTEMRAIKHTMELIAHSLCIANGPPAKVAREGWPGKTALLNGQNTGTKSELQQSPELTDAHWQLITGLKSRGESWAMNTVNVKLTRCSRLLMGMNLIEIQPYIGCSTQEDGKGVHLIPTWDSSFPATSLAWA